MVTRAPARTLPVMVCKPDQHMLLSCPVCNTPKVADMEMFPFCSTTCRRKGSAR